MYNMCYAACVTMVFTLLPAVTFTHVQNIHICNHNIIRVSHLFKAYGGHDTRKSFLRGSATVVGYAIVRYAHG